MLTYKYVLHTVSTCVYLYSTRYQAVSCGEDELFSAGAAGGRQDDFASCRSIMSSQDKLLLGHTGRIHSRHNLDLLSRLLIRHNLSRRIRGMLGVWSTSLFHGIVFTEQSSSVFYEFVCLDFFKTYCTCAYTVLKTTHIPELKYVILVYFDHKESLF